MGVFVVHRQAMIRYASALLLSMFPPHSIKRAGPNYVEFQDGIRISFLPSTDDIEERLRGRKNYVMKYDHHVWESQYHVKKTTESRGVPRE